jgi:hypothetical protein
MTNAVNIAQSGSNNQTFRNRIINGAMTIDQRNAGASVTPVNNSYSGVDRWKYFLGAASKCTTQRLSASPPPNFTNYLNITSTSAYTVGSAEAFFITQIIEGFNVADLGWGTANAQPVTLSFWVQSSLTGTFGGAIVNEAQTRNWTFAYTITAANTWQQVSITLPGPTSGTWNLGTNSNAMYVAFTFAAGASAQGAPSTSWATVTAGVFAPTGQVSLVGTNGATWNITGVQLEEGTAASPFENRLYGQELALCQRYFQRTSGYNVLASSGTSATGSYSYIVEMRASPSLSLSAVLAISDGGADFTQSSTNVTVGGGTRITPRAVQLSHTNFSGLTTYRPHVVMPNTSGEVLFSAEL